MLNLVVVNVGIVFVLCMPFCIVTYMSKVWTFSIILFACVHMGIVFFNVGIFVYSVVSNCGPHCAIYSPLFLILNFLRRSCLQNVSIFIDVYLNFCI